MMEAAETEDALCEDVLHALDIPVLLLDSDFCTLLSNTRWHTLCSGGLPIPRGSSLEDVTGLMASGSYAGRAGLRLGAEEIARSVRSAPCKIALHTEGSDPMVLWARYTTGGRILVTIRARVLPETATIAAQERLEEVIEALPDGVGLYDENLTLRMSNAALHRLAHGDQFPAMPYGSPLPEHCAYVYGTGELDLPDEINVDVFTEMIVDAVLNKRSGLEIPKRDGTILEFSSQPTPFGGYLVVMRDITERKNRARVDAQMGTIVQSLGEGLALYDTDLRLVLSNSAIWDMTSGEPDPSRTGAFLANGMRRGIDAGDLLVPEGETPETYVAALIGAVRERVRDEEVRLSGDRTLSFSAFDAPEGGTLLLVRDVTEKRRAERAAEEAHALLRTIVDASPTTFLVTRFDDGKVVFMPKPSRDRFGDVPTARRFFLNPGDRQDYLNALSKTGSLVDYPVRFRRGDGSVMQGLTSARIIEFGGERLIVSSTRDITDELALRSELERQREIAHQNEKLSALGSLLAGVAHELNNPLSIIVANAMMLEQSNKDPAQTTRIERIDSAARRSARIVDTFLAMARNRPQRLETVPALALVEEALGIADFGLREMQAEVVIDVSEGLPPVKVDRDQVIQVFANLIVNSEHALAEWDGPCRLVISAQVAPGTGLRFTFADSGPGIPADHLSRVFEPYFTTKDVGEGTGLGLAYCRKVVISHGGDIRAGNSPDGGCEMQVDLPVQHAPAGGGHSERLSGKRALIVGPADTLLRELVSMGLACTHVSDLPEALQAKDLSAMDMVLVAHADSSMVAERLAVAEPSLVGRIGIMTTQGPAGNSAPFKETAVPVLSSPWRADDLVHLVAQLMEQDQHAE